MVLPGCSQPEVGYPVKRSRVCADEWGVGTTLSCGECGAPLRPEQDWCSLCYAAVKPVFDPLTAPLDDVIDAATAAGEHSGPALPAEPQPVPVPERTVQAVRVGEPTEKGEPAVDVSDVDVMLSMLAAEHRRSEPASGLAERLGDRSTRVAVMVGGTLIVGAVLFAIFTALGALV